MHSPVAPNGRQGFLPDGSRSFEEIDRLAIGVDGTASLYRRTRRWTSIASSRRAASPRGCRRISAPMWVRATSRRKCAAQLLPYKPITSQPRRRDHLANASNDMQALSRAASIRARSGRRAARSRGERSTGSTSCSTRPCRFAAIRRSARMVRSATMDRATSSIPSIGLDRAPGLTRPAAIVAALWCPTSVFAAREVAKVDARPGGYVAVGGHGGIVGNISHTGRIALTYLPVFKHTYRSDLKITTLPNAVKAAKKGSSGIEMVDVAIKDGNGKLLPGAIPVVTISADGSYSGMDYGHDTAPEIDLIASIEHKLSLGLLTGFVIQGLVPQRPDALAHAKQVDAQGRIQRHSGGHSRPRRANGLCRCIGVPDCRHQSHGKQGSILVDGLPNEVWEPAGSQRSRQADAGGIGRHPQSRRRVSSGV